MRKARVIVTLDCNRNCENCCNKESVFDQHRVITDIGELLQYDEIMITGGEPMLISEKVAHFIAKLRKLGFNKNIYLYTALFTPELLVMYSTILSMIDGIHFTVHFEAKDREIVQLKMLSEDYLLRGNSRISKRLAIDSRLYDKYDFSNIDFSAWSVVRKLKWLVDCPLPANEDLLIFKI